MLALLGPSGSGKTTTLRLLAGFETPDGGRVVLDGRDVTELAPVARRFGMVFQHYALFPHLDVGANVAFGLESRGVRGTELARRVGEALAPGRPGRIRAAAGGQPLGRAAAAGGAGARARPRAERAAARRAALQSRSRAPGAHPAGAPQAGPPARHHHRAGDPRAGRGLRPGRPDRAAAQRAPRAARHAGRALRHARHRLRGGLHRPGERGARHQYFPRARRGCRTAPGQSAGPARASRRRVRAPGCWRGRKDCDCCRRCGPAERHGHRAAFHRGGGLLHGRNGVGAGARGGRIPRGRA